jgi:hypothetical protein
MSSFHRRLGAFCGAFLLAFAVPAVSRAMQLKPETVLAWDTYVSATEARVERELTFPGGGFLALDFMPYAERYRARLLGGEVLVFPISTTDEGGEGIPIPDGTIHHWRGTVFLPGVNLETYLFHAKHPEVGVPEQPEVLEKRILEQRPDEIRLFIKMTRQKFIKLTYNTEHRVTFLRWGPGKASSRSVSTRIAELTRAGSSEEQEKPEGRDRGFMWRLNSYWRYEEVDGGLVIEGESLLLSRDIPRGLRVLIDPLIDRSAHEMIENTLVRIRQKYSSDALTRVY